MNFSELNIEMVFALMSGNCQLRLIGNYIVVFENCLSI